MKLFARNLLLLTISALMTSSVIGADLPDQWYKDFAKAKQTAKQEDKPILAVFSAAWCGPCQAMVKSVYPKDNVKQYLNDWVPVYIDEADYPQVVRKFNVRAFPTFVLLNSQGAEAGRFVGGAQDGEGFIKRIEDASAMQEKMAEIEKKLAENPGDIQTLLEKAELTSSVDRNGAVEIYEKAYRIDSDKFMELADPQVASYIKNRVEFEQQIKRANAMVEKNPENARPYIKRANIYLGDSFTKDLSYNPATLPKALADLQKALELGPKNTEQVEETVTFLTAWQDQENADDKLAEFVEKYPDSAHTPFAQYRLYASAMESENADKAVKHLEQAAKTAPDGRFADWLNARLAEMNAEQEVEKLNIEAPKLSVAEYIKGEPVTMTEGNVYVIEFWATWCPPCRASIPHLTELQEKYENATIIGISNEGADKVKPFVEEKGDEMAYTVAVDDDRSMSKAYMDTYGVRGIPHAFIVDQQGKIVWHGHPLDGLDEVLPQVIDGNFDQLAYLKEKKLEQAQSEKLLAAYKGYFQNIKDNPEKAEEQAQYVLENTEDDANMLNALAWRILTNVPEEKRDINLALEAAKKALEIDPNAQIYDTYALACFQAGQIEEAIANQSKAVSMTEEKEWKDKLQATLEKYKAAATQ
ncbi:Cytochrome c biogenesis protein CycY [Anaerohalosphaera lusitana]|uniref:Cytochrome c biogenesis protein CycY n=1 Tax=Anaerohalosphaera lusitana TaxID=1936003 RepID=A0A1U9NHT6_9BACT|nr:thioredoxin domain-containing protein [Anaerohalosphaera lusitana]AQT67318.1 Cytochrome c biogenesis protein CycY [Anaerohalosphaera lusitana]